MPLGVVEHETIGSHFGVQGRRRVSDALGAVESRRWFGIWDLILGSPCHRPATMPARCPTKSTFAMMICVKMSDANGLRTIFAYLSSGREWGRQTDCGKCLHFSLGFRTSAPQNGGGTTGGTGWKRQPEQEEVFLLEQCERKSGKYVGT